MAPSSLRQRMHELMRVRNYSERTQKTCLVAVAKFAAFFHTPPDKLGPAEILTYQLHLRDVRHISFSFFNQVMPALRLFYGEVLERELWRCCTSGMGRGPVAARCSQRRTCTPSSRSPRNSTCWRSTPPRSEPSDDPNENLLGSVLRVLRVPKEAQRHTVHVLLHGANHGLQGVAVSRLRPSNFELKTLEPLSVRCLIHDVRGFP